tara:strand:+ start:1319 stop:1807 length:489 start_codon:yes stop_codon:yes gene_type:complete
MKLINTLLTILFISLLSSPSWSVTFGELVERDGLYYEKFTDVPYTGKVTGEEQGSFRNGEREGTWVSYWENGQLSFKENYKNGQREGTWVGYFENGQLSFKENYKNGKEEGEYISYWGDGRLLTKGNFKNGKATGAWVGYLKDGTVFKDWTGTIKDGKKISD